MSKIESKNLLKTSKTSNTVQKKYIYHSQNDIFWIVLAGLSCKKIKHFLTYRVSLLFMTWLTRQQLERLEHRQLKAALQRKKFARCEKHCSVTDDDHKSRAYRYTRVRKHAVRRQSWFTGTILTWCWANTQSYLQLVRTDSSPNIDFSAQTPDKQSLCGWQSAIIIQKKKRRKKSQTLGFQERLSSVSTGTRKVYSRVLRYCGQVHHVPTSYQTWHRWYPQEEPDGLK